VITRQEPGQEPDAAPGGRRGVPRERANTGDPPRMADPGPSLEEEQENQRANDDGWNQWLPCLTKEAADRVNER
jgi:hypothetical protein